MAVAKAQGWPAGLALASRVALGPQAPRAGTENTMPTLLDSLCCLTSRFVSEGMTAPSPWWFSPRSKVPCVGGAHVSIPAWLQARVCQWDRLAELKVIKVKVLVAQLCLTLCNFMDCRPPGSSVHGILPARILEWVDIPFSRRSSQPRDQTQVSCSAGRFFTI